MNISKYTGYFHDGIIHNLVKTDDEIKIDMESCELNQQEIIKEEIILSQHRTIKGTLYIRGIKNLKINHHKTNQFKMNFDDGEILRFRLIENKVFLLIKWIDYPPKEYIEFTEIIEIEAEKIFWQNSF